MLRPATDAEIEQIRQWRNHQKVRDSSIWIDYITPEGHAAWWARVQDDPQRDVLIFSYRGIDCGVVTINDHDREARTTEWGFFLDVDGLEARGQLLPAWIELEKEAVRHGFEVMGLWSMGGRTLAWNEPVLALHRRFGFVEIPERCYVTNIAGVDQQVIWTELTAEHRLP